MQTHESNMEMKLLKRRIEENKEAPIPPARPAKINYTYYKVKTEKIDH
jgi:hypothetical protein